MLKVGSILSLILGASIDAAHYAPSDHCFASLLPYIPSCLLRLGLILGLISGSVLLHTLVISLVK